MSDGRAAQQNFPRAETVGVEDLRSGAWDSAAWREMRDAKLLEWLQNADAVRFFLHMSHFVEVFDDLVDQDVPVSEKDLAHAVFSALYHIPANPFFNAHRAALLPVVFTCTNAWLDSNDLAGGSESEKALAYTLKGLGVEVLLSCIAITRGTEYLRTVSADVRRVFMAHQPFADYCKETAHVV
jgi:exosortase/archaeosortase